ncbi:MAG: hypothetical protein INR69_17400 [Mucilaginibacter polytrichastri]|nr:hypothetical protein [Mucilaginibacter polytrichastri]
MKIALFTALFFLFGTLTAETVVMSTGLPGPKPKRKYARVHRLPPPDTTLLRTVRRLDVGMLKLNTSTKRMKP